MFRERNHQQNMSTSACHCNQQSLPPVKTTIKKFIQLESKLPVVQKRNSRIIELVEPPKVLLKFPIVQPPPQQVYQQENYYDEINPIEETLSTAYDHLTRSYLNQPCYQSKKLNNLSAKINCFKGSQRKVHNDQYFSKASQNLPPPPPPLQKLPRVARQQMNTSMSSSVSINSFAPNKQMPNKMNKSFTSSHLSQITNRSPFQVNTERNYLFEKWSHDSSGYNSSQDLVGRSNNSSIISYCSLSDSYPKKASNSNLVDSGLSTLHLDYSDDYDATENFSTYSNLSHSSHSFNDSLEVDLAELKQLTSPFPQVKTCMVAQIKKVKPSPPTLPPVQKRHSQQFSEPIYENLINSNYSDLKSVKKNYSVNDVLFSLKKMELNAKPIQFSTYSVATSSATTSSSASPEYLAFSPIDNESSDNKIMSPPKYSTLSTRLFASSTPGFKKYAERNQRDLDDYLCDEEVEFYLSPHNNQRGHSVNSLPPIQSSCYKYTNKNVAIWEQLV